MKNLLRYFTRGEWTLWAISVYSILLAFLLFDRVNYLTLIASLVGVTSLRALRYHLLPGRLLR